MTWLDAGHPLTALIALLAGLAVGWFVPLLIAVVPEPKPESEDEAPAELLADAAPAEPPPVKLLNAEVAARPRLAWWSAVATGVGAAAVGASVGPEWPLAFLMPIVPFCVALAIIDAHTRLLPSVLVLPLNAGVILVAGVVAYANDDLDSLWRALIAMAVFRSIFWVLWWFRSSGLGFGDVRLAALLTFALGYLGWAEPITWVYVALPLFVVPRLLAALVRRDRSLLKERTPFGPALIIAAPVAVAIGAPIATALGY